MFAALHPASCIVEQVLHCSVAVLNTTRSSTRAAPSPPSMQQLHNPCHFCLKKPKGALMMEISPTNMPRADAGRSPNITPTHTSTTSKTAVMAKVQLTSDCCKAHTNRDKQAQMRWRFLEVGKLGSSPVDFLEGVLPKAPEWSCPFSFRICSIFCSWVLIFWFDSRAVSFSVLGAAAAASAAALGHTHNSVLCGALSRGQRVL